MTELTDRQRELLGVPEAYDPQRPWDFWLADSAGNWEDYMEWARDAGFTHDTESARKWFWESRGAWTPVDVREDELAHEAETQLAQDEDYPIHWQGRVEVLNEVFSTVFQTKEG